MAKTKTVSFCLYQAWGTTSTKHIDLYYGRNRIKDFEGGYTDELLETAKAWALIKGYTHYKLQGSKVKL